MDCRTKATLPDGESYQATSPCRLLDVAQVAKLLNCSNTSCLPSDRRRSDALGGEDWQLATVACQIP